MSIRSSAARREAFVDELSQHGILLVSDKPLAESSATRRADESSGGDE